VQSASCAPAGTDPVNFQTDDVTDGGNSSADAQSDFVWGPCNAFKVTYATGTTSARVPAADYYWFNTNGDIMSASQMPVQDYGAFPKDREAGVLHGNRMTVSSVTCA
jgi:hypothetical protein